MTIDSGLNSILAMAYHEAQKRNHEFLTPEHILYASLNYPEGVELIQACGGDVKALQREMDHFFSRSHFPLKEGADPVQSLGCAALLETAMLHVRSAGKEVLKYGDVLAAIFLLKESFARHFLKKQGINRIDVLAVISHGRLNDEEEDVEAEQQERSDQGPHAESLLDRYTTNLTQAAKEGLLDPVIGRDALIKRTIQVLCRRQKNNPLHVGEPGVGKTALTEGLALHIAQGFVPEALKDHQVFRVDLSSLIAGTKYRGDFEERMKRLMSELTDHPAAILFIDEIHNLVGAGAVNGGTMDASNILKPLLGVRKIRCIGATTFEEFNRVFEKDRALSRRFQKIDVPEPSADDTIEILNGLKSRFERHHRVKYSPDALEAAVTLSVKHIHERYLPDKAIDVIDEAGAWVQLHDFKREKLIDRNCIEEVVSEITATPRETLRSTDVRDLMRLEPDLKTVVFGQDTAIRAVCEAIKRSRAGFADEDRPVASFLFVGPTGVGKTELSRQLALKLGVKLLRFDMSEYQEKHSVARLIGSPPGYVGFEQGGLLTDAVRKTPHAVLLLDEIEKAHSDIYNTLLQVMDGAVLTDNSGRKSDFRHVILIMTSNVGSRELARTSIGFRDSPVSSSLNKILKDNFSPEFRNRLDRIVLFNALKGEHIRQVAIRQLDIVRLKLKSKAITMTFSKGLIDWLERTGYNQQFGAREMKRLVDERIKPLLTDEIISGRLKSGCSIRLLIRGRGPALSLLPNR